MDSKLEETRPQRALTSTPFNTFGMNWNTDCELNLIAQYQCLITDANVAEWDENSATSFQNLVESHPRKLKAGD